MSIFVYLLPLLFVWWVVMEIFCKDRSKFSLPVVIAISLSVIVFTGFLIADSVNGIQVKETEAKIYDWNSGRWDIELVFSDSEGNKYWGIEPFMGVIACDGPVRITYLPNTKYLLKVEQYITPGEIDLMISPTGHTTGYKELYNHSSFFGFSCIVMLIIDLYVLFTFKKKKKKTESKKYK